MGIENMGHRAAVYEESGRNKSRRTPEEIAALREKNREYEKKKAALETFMSRRDYVRWPDSKYAWVRTLGHHPAPDSVTNDLIAEFNREYDKGGESYKKYEEATQKKRTEEFNKTSAWVSWMDKRFPRDGWGFWYRGSGHAIILDELENLKKKFEQEYSSRKDTGSV